jgi:hypothetical protein
MFRTALAGLLLCAPVARAGPSDDILKNAPANTNAVVLIDVKKAFASGVAKKAKWEDDAKASGYGGLGFVPPGAERIAIAGEVNFTTMTRDFQVGFVQMRDVPSFKALAAREGGLVDEIAGRAAVVSPREVYFTQFPGQVLAGVYPGDRQYIARWLKAADAKKLGALAPVLKPAVDAADAHTITIALDLEDVVDRAAVKLGLSVSPVVAKQKDVTLGNLSAFVCTVKGLTFTADVGDRIDARITIEFQVDVLYKKFLKDLFLELLDAYGIALGGTENWEATFNEKSLTLSGQLDPADLKRLVSLFAFPRPDLEPEMPGANDQPNAGATQRYMSAVTAILNDLKGLKEPPNQTDQNYAKTATWHDKAAAQIEHLGRRNVDPLAADAAFAVAKNLRAIASSLRGVPIELTAANDKAYSVVTGGNSYVRPVWGPQWHPYWGGWWGGYRQWVHEPLQVQTNLGQVFEERAKAISGDKKRRIEAWTKIDDTLSEARRKLGDKYKSKF